MILLSPTNSSALLALYILFSVATVVASSCTQDSDCGNGGKCGRSEALTDAPFVCCTSGQASYETFSLRNVCTELSSGAACNKNSDLCASGVCGNDNVCIDEKLAAGESCRDDNMCELGACGRSEALTDSPFVCCTSGQASYEGWNLKNVCTDLLPGAACNGEDDLCWSKTCGTDGVCTKQVDAYPCFVDDDCQSNVCGKVEATLDASYVCCPNSETVYADIAGVCTAFGGEGAVCFDDSTCKSGVCLQQTCRGGKQEIENDFCEADHHCASESCIMGSCAPFSSLNSRNEYFNGKAACPLDTLSSANEGDTSVVTLDVYGDRIETSWMDSMINMVTSEYPDSTATTNTLVGQEVLVGIDGCANGESVVVQQQGNKVCFGFQKEDDDGDGNSSFTCSNQCIEIGASGSFETYDKGDLDCIGGFFGSPVQCFFFGTNEKCRIKTTGSTVSQPIQTAGSNPTSTSGSTVSQPNQSAGSNPTSTSGSASQPNQTSGAASASQPNQTTGTNPTSTLALALDPTSQQIQSQSLTLQTAGSNPTSTSGSASQPNQSVGSNPTSTSGSASQPVQTAGSNPTSTSGSVSQPNQSVSQPNQAAQATMSSSTSVAIAYCPTLFLLVQIVIFVVAL